MHALIIDDSRAMRRIISKIMISLGFEIIEAENGAEGYAHFVQHSETIGAVLVDWNMPVMNGLEFVKKVRDQAKYNNHKLVMVTTETEPTRMARALMAGVDEFVMKPFTKDILVKKMRLIGIEIQPAASN